MVSDIPAGDVKIANLFLQCTVYTASTVEAGLTIAVRDWEFCYPRTSVNPDGRKKLFVSVLQHYSTLYDCNKKNRLCKISVTLLLKK